MCGKTMKLERGMVDNDERRQTELKEWVEREEEVEICKRKREIWKKEKKWEKFQENLSEKW